MAAEQMEASSFQARTLSRSPDRADLISPVTAKLVWPPPEPGPGRGTLLGVRSRGVRSLRNQMTEKHNTRDIKMYDES